jgi:FkbM family methyltransferase
MTNQMNTQKHDNTSWKNYDGNYPISMKHAFSLYLRPGCEYSRKRYVYKIAESNELDFLKTQPQHDFVCLDVGANIGYWSKFLVEISKVSQLHAFEPDPITCKILERNLVGYSNVTVNQAAIGDSDGYLELFLDPHHSGDNRPIFTEGRQAIKVPCLTLDSYVKKANLNRVDFLKIDIQGGGDFCAGRSNRVVESLQAFDIGRDSS